MLINVAPIAKFCLFSHQPLFRLRTLYALIINILTMILNLKYPTLKFDYSYIFPLKTHILIIVHIYCVYCISIFFKCKSS